MTESEVADVARGIIAFVAEVTGPDHPPVWRGIVGAPCDRADGTVDHDVYWYLAGAQIADVPVAEHIALVGRVHDAVVERAWGIRYFAAHEDTGTAMLVCTHPRNGYELTVNSTTPPTAIAVTVGSTPVRLVAGDSGANGRSAPPSPKLPGSAPGSGPGAGLPAEGAAGDSGAACALPNIRDILG